MNGTACAGSCATPTCSPRSSVVLVVTMLVVPLPSPLLSLLITLNIAAALTIVAATMYLGKALDFAAFPSLLLLTHDVPPGDQRVGHAPDPDHR